MAVLILLCPLAGCGKGAAENDIVILFTTDVHCEVDGTIGYASLAAYKKELQSKTEYVTLVDCGDAIDGGYIGTVSKGEYIIDLMNAVGYDFCVLGNHEFAYGVQQLGALTQHAHAQYLGCNITYSGSGENALSALKPYEIVEYGDTKVAFIGVTTPQTILNNAHSFFEEDGVVVYDFCGASGDTLYSRVQKNIDECLSDGADYVVLLTHLGSGDSYSPFSSNELAQNTVGADAVLDGHAHTLTPCRVEQNRDGEDVLISSPGYGFEAFGQLTITANGNVISSVINYYAPEDSEVADRVANVKSLYEAELIKPVGTSEVSLLREGSDGSYLVRCRETAIGNFCADAFRAAAGADIAVENGGSIRADILPGDITYGDIMALHPFGNTLCVIKVTGSTILDMLEMSCAATTGETMKDGEPVGISGGFLQVSGLKFTVDTSVPSSVVKDSDGSFVSVDGARRVKDVLVQGADGAYAPIDPDAEYTLASNNYIVKDGGDGYSMFSDCEIQIDGSIMDYQVILDYLTDTLGGSIGTAYAQTEGRITVQ